MPNRRHYLRPPDGYGGSSLPADSPRGTHALRRFILIRFDIAPQASTRRPLAGPPSAGRRFGPAPLPLRCEVPSVRALGRLCVDLLSFMHHFQFCAHAGRTGRHRSAALRATSLLRPQVSCKTLDRRSHPRVWTSMTRSMALLLVWHVIGCDPESRAHRPAPETSVAASVAATTSARPCGSAVPAELVDLFRRCAGATSETCSSHGGQWDPIALDCVCASPDRGCPCTSSHDCVGHCATLKGRDDCETATVGHCTGTLGGCVCVLNDDGSPGELCR